MKKLSLKIKLTLIMIALSLLCAGTVGSVILFKARDSIENLSMQYAKNASKASASNIVKYLEPYWFTADAIGQVMERYEDLPADKRRHFFNSMLETLVKENQAILGAWCNWEPNALEGNDSRYTGVPGTEPDGRFAPNWVRTPSGIKVETLMDYDKPGNGDYYLLARNSGQATLLNPYPNKINGKEALIISIAVPIHSKKGTVLGVVGIDFTLETIQKITLANKPYKDALIATFSNNGTVAAHFDPSRIGKKIQESERDMLGPYLEDYMNALKEGKPYSYVRYIPAVGSDMVFFFSPVRVGESTTPWNLATAVVTKTVMAPVYEMMRVAIYISIAMLIATILVALYLTRSILRPLQIVVSALSKIEKGDMTVRTDLDRGDELGTLSKALDSLSSKLQSIFRNLHQNSNTLAGSAEELYNVGRQVTSTIKQVSVNINAMSSGAEEASVNANEVAGAAEQMSTNMNTIAAAVEEMSTSISQISSNAGDAKKIAGDATVKSHEATDTMNKLGTAAKEIGQVTEVIKKIADKTNLLALNATIEAASSGAAGKGFAVVAGEIKELANQSAASADDIARRIEGIQVGTGAAVTVISGVSEIIEKINHSVESISNHVGQQTKASNEIASNVGQANIGAKRVAGAINEVAKGSRDIARNAGETAKGSSNFQGAEQINQGAGELARIAGDLKNVLSQFKV